MQRKILRVSVFLLNDGVYAVSAQLVWKVKVGVRARPAGAIWDFPNLVLS